MRQYHCLIAHEVGNVVLTLYGDLDSGNVYKVRLVLARLGILYRRVDTTQNRGEPETAQFRAINPIGKIPTLVFDDGRVLSESGAILFYFAQGSGLWPRGDWQQAQVLRWMFFEQYSHEPYIAVNRHLKRHLPPVELSRLADRIAANHQRGEQALAVTEQHLSGADWLVGEGFTIADIALFAYTHTAEEGGFDLAHYAAIGRWLDRVRAEPRHIPQMQEEPGVPVARWPG